MDPIHAHLLLNHIPILGSLFGIILLVIGMLRKNPILEYAGIVTLVLAALFAGAAFNMVLVRDCALRLFHLG